MRSLSGVRLLLLQILHTGETWITSRRASQSRVCLLLFHKARYYTPGRHGLPQKSLSTLRSLSGGMSSALPQTRYYTPGRRGTSQEELVFCEVAIGGTNSTLTAHKARVTHRVDVAHLKMSRTTLWSLTRVLLLLFLSTRQDI